MAPKNNRRTRRVSEENELETTYRDISGYNGQYNYTTIKNRSPIIIAICIAIFAVLLCIVAGYLYFIDAELDGIILENVTVAGIDVGGMTQADAITAVRLATDNTYSTTPMVVKVLDSQISIPVEHVGTFDVRGAVKAAYKFGNSGSAAKRKYEQQIAMTTGYSVDLTPYLDLNESGIRSLISELGSSTFSQSTYEITGTAPSQTLLIKLGMPEYGLDLNALYKQVLQAYSANHFEVIGQCSVVEPQPINLDDIYLQVYVSPIDAYYDRTKNEIIPETDGYGFDLDAAKETLAKAKFGSTVEIPISIIKPAITSEALSSMLFRDTLATYTASSKSDINRDTNLRLACEAINGMILYPDDVFSYNKSLGERSTARGYRPGPSYSGNKTVMTIGGGICQVSSALYYCALMAEMEILQRKNHGFMPSYMPVGLDATVSWGSIDFRFKNTLDYPVRIEATASGGKTTISLIGTDMRDYRFELESDILSTTRYQTTYETMSANNTNGYEDGDYIVEPYTGYDVKTYLCKYEVGSGNLISRTFIAHSIYKKRDAVVCDIIQSDMSDENSTEPTN